MIIAMNPKQAIDMRDFGSKHTGSLSETDSMNT